MKKLLDIDSPIIRFLARLADLVLLNTLFIISSLPLFTIGASLCALQTSLQNWLHGKTEKVIQNYFRIFKQNFKQATLFWLIFLVLGFIIYSDFRLLNHLPIVMEFLIGAASILMALLVFIVSNYLFFYIGRYENSNKMVIRNCLSISIQFFYQSLFLLVFNGFIIYFTFSSPAALLTMIYFLTFGGFALINFASSLMIKQVFDKIEKRSSDLKSELDSPSENNKS